MTAQLTQELTKALDELRTIFDEEKPLEEFLLPGTRQAIHRIMTRAMSPEVLVLDPEGELKDDPTGWIIDRLNLRERALLLLAIRPHWIWDEQLEKLLLASREWTQFARQNIGPGSRGRQQELEDEWKHFTDRLMGDKEDL